MWDTSRIDGPIPSRVKDITGQRFNSLTVVGFSHVAREGKNVSHSWWTCVCDCGAQKLVRGAHLRSGTMRSCGCKSKESLAHGRTLRKTHGASETKTYNIWSKMKRRCSSPSEVSWKYYGARGISVCDRWSSFENFLQDMGHCPEGYSIERINVNRNYSPENCKWIPRAEQSRNTRKTIWVKLNGEKMILKDAADRMGRKYMTVYNWVAGVNPTPREVSLILEVI